MIKIITNLSNSGIQNQSFSQNNEVKISDWFQLILLTLIDANLFGKEITLEGPFISDIPNNNFKGENLAENPLKNNEEILKKNFVENLDQIKLFLAYLLGNNALGTHNEENLDGDKNYEILKNVFFGVSKIESLNLETLNIDKEKLSSIEEIISHLLNLNETQKSQLNQIFDDFIAELSTDFEKIDTSTIKENLFKFLNYLNVTKDNFSKLEKGINNEILMKDNVDRLEVNNSFNKVENLINTENDTNLNVQKNVEKAFQQEHTQPYMNVFHPERKYQAHREIGDNFSVLSSRKTSPAFNKIGERFDNNIFVSKSEVTEGEILDSKNSAIKNERGFNKEFNFYTSLDKEFKLETSLINRVADSNFINISHTPENVIRVEDIKTVSFHKLPDDLFEIIKDMSFEIQPEGEKKAFIKLEPPDMGFLDLEIKTKNKDIEIAIRVEKPEVLQDIKNHLQHIRASLEESGFNIKGFQLFLGSGFDERALAKNFEDNKKYSYGQEFEEIEKIENKNLEGKELIKFYNVNGKYYYIA